MESSYLQGFRGKSRAAPRTVTYLSIIGMLQKRKGLWRVEVKYTAAREGRHFDTGSCGIKAFGKLGEKLTCFIGLHENVVSTVFYGL